VTIRQACIIIGTVVLVALFLFIQHAEAEPPIIIKYIPPQEIESEGSITIDLLHFEGGAVFEDPDGDNLTFGFANDDYILVSINGPIVTFTAAPDFSGFVSDLILWAEDENGERSENMTLAFSVKDNGYFYPKVTAFEPNRTSVTINEGHDAVFKILEVSLEYPSDLMYKWYVDDDEVTGQIESEMSYPNVSTLDRAFNTSGKYVIKVYIHQSDGEYSYDFLGPVWTLTIIDTNRPPMITYQTNDQALSPGTDVHLQVVGHDPDWDVLSYVWYYSPDMSSLEEIGTGDREVFTRDLPLGKHYFVCEVSDANETITSKWVTITMEEEEKPASVWPFVALALVVASTLAINFLMRRDHSKAY